jgi:2-dehydropantoate 2-reductase
MDEPVVIGYQKKGPVILGTPDNSMLPEMDILAEIFGRGVETVVTPDFQDAAHSKLVVNLANSLTTLVGFKVREISDRALFQKLLTTLAYEGVEIVRAAGYRQCRLGGMPPWWLYWVGAKFPRFLTRPTFEATIAKLVLSSMAQDIIQRGGRQHELEFINGYILALADKLGMRAPVNRTIYDLCRERFSREPFEPMDVREVWRAVRERIESMKDS